MGKGSFGEVYLTSKKGHSQLYATKKIPKSMADAPGIFKEGLQELINSINSGDNSIYPYMEFAKTHTGYCEFPQLVYGGEL